MDLQRIHGSKYRFSGPGVLKPNKHPDRWQLLVELPDRLYEMDHRTLHRSRHPHLSDLDRHVLEEDPEDPDSARD